MRSTIISILANTILAVLTLFSLVACGSIELPVAGTAAPGLKPAEPQSITNGSVDMPAETVPGKNSFSISISAFANEGYIPARYTCSGINISPAIQISNPPQGTTSLALIVEDPDAPSGLFIHWVLYNIPPILTALPEGLKPGPQLAGIGTQGKSGFGSNGYGGPCPPPGTPHHYHFRTYALDLGPDLPAGLTASQLKARINGHILAETDWIGLFKR